MKRHRFRFSGFLGFTPISEIDSTDERVLIHRNLSVIRVTNQTNNKLWCVQLSPFSSSAADNQTPKPISKIAKEDSFTVNYLINTFGFSQNKALSASKYLKVNSTEKPDLVIAFLKNNGFTAEQIGCLVQNFPNIILCHPEKTLLPKIEFFRSLGVSDAELTKIFLAVPEIFTRSLKKQIIPSFVYVKSLFDSSGTSLGSINRFAEILKCDLESRLLPNVEILRDAGVPDSRIVALLQFQPRAFMTETEKFRKVVEDVKEMRFDPSGVKFILAISAFRRVRKPVWEKRVAVYKKWGWSENDVILAFERNPYCMMTSTDKITAVMDFVVNTMGFDSSLVLNMPQLIGLSLEKRLKPRFMVYEKLLEYGLITRRGSLLNSTFKSSESVFLKRFVQRYEKEVPELLELYQKELAVSKG